MRGTQPTYKLFIQGDFNGNIKITSMDYDDVHGGFDFGDKKGRV